MHSVASRRLAEALRPKVMSQSELAEKLEVSPQAVSKWVRGDGRPAPKLMAKIEEVLGIPMREWADESPEEAPAEEAPPASERNPTPGTEKAS